MKQGAVTTQQRDQFERDGYFVIEDPGLPESTLDGAIKDLEGRYEAHGVDRLGEDGVFYRWHRISDAWKISDNIKAIALHPPILGALEELYGRRPQPFQTLNFPRGTWDRAHSDTIHFNSMPPGYMCGVWVAFEDMDLDNGPVVYYPGSHKLPEVTMADVGVEAKEGEAEYLAYLDHIQGQIDQHDLKPEHATIKKGQAFIWAANLLHGGAPQNDMSRSRHSQVTHVYFEGCRYYTPLLSKDLDTEEGTAWRNPAWIA